MASGEPAIEIIAAAGSIPDVEADGLAGIEFGGGDRCCESDVASSKVAVSNPASPASQCRLRGLCPVRKNTCDIPGS